VSTESVGPIDQFEAFEQDQQILVAGIALVIVGSVLPWYGTQYGQFVGGGGGLFPLLLGAGAAAAIHYEGWTEQVMLVCVAIGAGVTLLALSGHNQFATVGLYTTAIGGISMAVGGYQRYEALQ